MLLKKCCVIFLIFFIQHSWTFVSGIYKVTLRNIENCANPDPAFEKEKNLQVDVKAYNKSGDFFFKGNVTVLQNMRGYFWKIKTGVEKSGVIKYTNHYKKLTCKSVIPRVIMMAANINYNEKTCEIKRGNYTFNKMDLSKLEIGAYYFPIKEIGESVVYMGLFNSKGTAFCSMARYTLKFN